ncbi:sensor histidine kinase, partial [Clostridium sp.]|uniref:sensor histidine kinase n=1 Tax=Clostridium sp. TaxID=1506 RepID=UPI003F3782BC
LENAFKYTKEDGKIELVIEEDSKNVIVKVIDNGIGIKEEDQSRIFDRFFRSNDIRATDIGGSGIGLSLLSSIAENLGLKIKLESRYNEGSQFTLIIPKK